MHFCLLSDSSEPDGSRRGCLRSDGLYPGKQWPCLLELELRTDRSTPSGRRVHPGGGASEPQSDFNPTPSRRGQFYLDRNCDPGVISLRGRSTWKRAICSLHQDSGSAIVEFTVLAIPLLVPIVIYLGVVNNNSTIASDLHNLARQSARAFITSTSETYEEARLQNVLSIFESKILRPHGIAEIPTLSVQCSASPCLTPDAKVKVTASLIHYQRNFTGIFRFISSPDIEFSASDTQVVDAWR